MLHDENFLKDLQKLKRFAENANEDEVIKKLSHDPCTGCPSQKSCKFIQHGKVCSGVAKELLDHEIEKIERQKKRKKES